MPHFTHDNLNFHYQSEGAGLPVVLLHGLGGDVDQPRGLAGGLPGVRLITLDFRGHGQTEPLGPEEKISIRQFAADVPALMDALSLPSAVVGGISLGAAVALRFALDYPARVRALVLSRVAWLEGPNLYNQRVFAEIAGLIRQYGTAEGKARFRQSETYAAVSNQSSDGAKSLLGHFDSPQAAASVCRLERLPADAPIQSLHEAAGIAVPTLVLANGRDPVHPLAFGQAIAGAIPGATFAELTSKSESLERHTADFRRELLEYLQRHFHAEMLSPC